MRGKPAIPMATTKATKATKASKASKAKGPKTSPGTVFGIRMFRGGSTATRMRIAMLQQLDTEIPEFTYLRFEAGTPGHFIVSFGDEPLALTLRQVEAFAAGLRTGYRLARQEPIDTRAIAGHYLPDGTEPA